MSASIGEPADGLRVLHSFTGVPSLSPPSQPISVSLVLSLLTICQVLRAIWPPVCAGEVGVESILKIRPASDTAWLQVIEPDARCALQHLWNVSCCPVPVPSGNKDSCKIVIDPIFRLSTAVVSPSLPGQLETPESRLVHDSWTKTCRSWRTLPVQLILIVEPV